MLLELARKYQSFIKCIDTTQAEDISRSSINYNKTQNIISSHAVDAVRDGVEGKCNWKEQD